MNTRHILSNLTPTLVLLGLTATAACGDDEKKQENLIDLDAGAGGSGTGGRGAGGTPTGGRGGAGGGPAAGGASAAGGTPAAGGVNGTGGSPVPDAGEGGIPEGGPGDNSCPRNGSADAGSDAGARAGVLLIAGTDYVSTTEVAAVDLRTGQVLGRSTFADGDAVPRASGGRGFVLERSSGAVNVLSATGTVERRIPLGPSDGAAARLNPHDIVVVPGEASSKAYVSLFDGNALAIVDVDAGTVTGSVSLASLVDPADTDGSVDVDTGFYDATTRRAYFVASRIDLNTANVPPYELACPGVPSLLIAIDVGTDALVDLNGAAAGEALALGLTSPADVEFDEAAGRVTILHSGCFEPGDGGSRRARHGIEVVTLATGASTVALAPTNGDFLSQMFPVGVGAAMVESFDANFAQTWARWTQPEGLTCTYPGVPEGAVSEGDDSVLGILRGSGDGGAAFTVVRHEISSGRVTNITPNPWASSPTAVGGAVIVR